MQAVFGGGLVFLVAFLTLSVIGTYLPGIPYLAIGQIVTAFFGPWVVVLSVAAAGLAVWRWRRDRRTRHVFTASCAAAAAIGCSIVVAAQLATIRASGAEVSLANVFAFGPALHRSPVPETEIYGRFEAETLPLAIYRPARQSQRLAPVLVYVHGGGWVSGNYRQRDRDMRWFADRGVLGVSVEYTLSTADRHLWALTQPQIGCALAWINANIQRYGGDPARVAMIGDSAGGNLVINVAYMANQKRLQPSCPGTLPHISAAVSLYPVIDVADFYRSNGDALVRTARDMAADYTGGSPSQFPARYAAVSSTPYIDPAAPATALIVGARDTLVPPQPAYDFAQKARQAGIEIQLIVVPFAGHSFEFLSGSINNQLTRSTTMHLLAAHGMAP